MTDFDALFPRASRNVFGTISATAYDALYAKYSELYAQFLHARGVHDDLVAREVWTGERITTLEQAALQARQHAEAEIERIETSARQDAERARGRNTVLEAANDAREQRVVRALADAAIVVGGLEFAVIELASLAEPGAGRVDDRQIERVLRRLFTRLVAAVSITPAESARPATVAALREAGGRRTWESDDVTPAGERPLHASGALAGGVVVLVCYEPQTFPDGDIPRLVERVCHALAASLAARERARARAGDRDHVTLLADETALERLRALRESQGHELTRVSLQLGARLKDDQLGLYGGPALNATLLDCAGQLDRLARDHGGEAFELVGSICCLVGRREADAVLNGARRIAMMLDLETEVTVS